MRDADMQESKTVLLVDDDADLLLAGQRRLTHAGFRVLTATSGASALEQMRAGGIDAISLDVELPGGPSGLEVAAALRRDPQTAQIPTIFITGSADEDFKQKCAAAGGRYFLAKPYDGDLLVQILRSIFATDELAEIRQITSAKRRQPVT
jgi:CheY-like chemotaxis protein